MADVADVTIAGNAAKKYSNLSYAGIEFTTTPIDATQMTGLHLDLWVTQAAGFKVKLVDFGANGVFGGGDDKEHDPTAAGSGEGQQTGEDRLRERPSLHTLVSYPCSLPLL